MLQIPRNTAENPLFSTDAVSKMLRALCKQGFKTKTHKIPCKLHLQFQGPANIVQIRDDAEMPCKLYNVFFQNPANIVQTRDFSCKKCSEYRSVSFFPVSTFKGQVAERSESKEERYLPEVETDGWMMR